MSLTPGQLQRIANAAGLSGDEALRVLEEFAVARALHNEVRIWKKEGRPLPKSMTGLKEFMQSAVDRAKQQQVRALSPAFSAPSPPSGRAAHTVAWRSLRARCRNAAWSSSRTPAAGGVASWPRRVPTRASARLAPTSRAPAEAAASTSVATACDMRAFISLYKPIIFKMGSHHGAGGRAC